MNGWLPRGLVAWTLVVVTAFSALSAVAGAVILLTPGSAGMPLSMLEGSPFDSFLWPALVLGIVIGGSQVVALVALLRKTPTADAWVSVAGTAMLIWIFVEVAIMHDVVFLHVLYFATGLAQLLLVLARRDVVPGLLR